MLIWDEKFIGIIWFYFNNYIMGVLEGYIVVFCFVGIGYRVIVEFCFVFEEYLG